jgi:hypothetical protein
LAPPVLFYNSTYCANAGFGSKAAVVGALPRGKLIERKSIASWNAPPRRLGRDRFGGRLYDLVRLDDGTIGFVRNAFDAELKQIIAEAIEELFPEPAA